MDTSENKRNISQNSGIRGAEFTLVVCMLIVLTALVFAILIIPMQWSTGAGTTSLSEILKFRAEILTVIITAFSAWIGAGAAYFFGRENMREATQAMLDMRQLPPREKLRQISLKELPPRPITWKVNTEDFLITVYDKLKTDVSWWFIVITKKDGSLETVVHEEAIWRFIDSLALDGKKPDEELKKITVQALLDYLKEEKNKDLATKVKDIYIRVTYDYTLGAVNDLMLDKKLFLSIITDESNKPVSYISSDDVRREFLKMS